MPAAIFRMNWKTISGLMGRKDEESGQMAKRQQIAKLIRIYDSKVNAGAATLIPADMAKRLSNFVAEMSSFSKRDVVLTGLVQLMEICERAPGQLVPELKVGSFESRGQTSLGFRIPLELDDRLKRLLRSLPGLILTECETINRGPFPSADEPVPAVVVK